MKTASTFRELTSEPRVEVTLDGKKLCLTDGANLAAALLVAGVTTFRKTPISDTPRGPFCMMGTCFDCLVEIDGVARQACMLNVRAGLAMIRLPDAQVPNAET